MLIRSKKQTTKRMQMKGRILIRTLWSVLASIDTDRVADSLANVHLGVRLPRPEGFMRDLLFVPDHRYAYWHAVAVHAFRRLG
jgi:hypothetical protein